jgi:4-amino-4-deoxy-L-arabinose transferase-like glycosyltransferase
VLLAGIAFFALLGRRDIVTSHEARVVQVARQMAESGWPWNASRVSVPSVSVTTINGTTQLAPTPDGRMSVNPWIVPVINGQIRLQKPPLPYWCDAVMFRLFGFSEAIARFPSALLGFIGALLIYDLAKHAFGRRVALPAMIVWFTTHFVVDEYRKTMADPYLAFATLLAIWAWIRASKNGDSHRFSCSPENGVGPRFHRDENGDSHGISEHVFSRGCFVVVFYVALGIGGLAKGPVVLITTLPGIAMWEIAMWRRLHPRRIATQWWGHLVGIALFAILLIPWLLLVTRELPQALAIWKYEIDAQEKPREPYYYFLTIWQLTLLWTIPWVIGVVMTLIHGRRGLRSPRGRPRAFALGWLIIVLAIFSLKGEKKNAYLLPIMPACVLLAGDAVAMLLRSAFRGRGDAIGGIALLAQLVIGVGFAVSIMVLAIRNHLGASAIGVGVVVLLISLFPWRGIYEKRPRQWMYLQATAYVAVLVVFIGLYMASLDRARSPRSFAAELLRVSHELNVPIWRAQSPEEVSVYLPIDLPDASAAGRVLIAVDDPKHAFAGSPRAFEAGIPDIRVRDERELQLSTSVTTRRYRLFDVTLDRGVNPIAGGIESLGERISRAAPPEKKGGVTEVTPPREIQN